MRKDDYDNLEIDSLLFVKFKGNWKPMSRDSISNRMKKYGQIVGIPDNRAHCQRKSRLNLVYEETGDLALAAELANHKSTETTRAYYCKPKSKSEVMDKINALKAKQSENNE